MAENTKVRLPVMLSDCTDPYQPLEREYKITRKCLEILAKNHFPLLIVTKSDMVTRDLDIFKLTPTVVSMTVTTLRKEVIELIEPYAPSPDRRLSALKKIGDEGIPTVLRIDPIIPTVNSDEEELGELVSKAAEFGVRQITASTMKPVRGFFSALRKVNPDVSERLLKVYADGIWIAGYKYLATEERGRIMRRLGSIVLRYGLAFATCREGSPELNTSICDGTAYCREEPLNRCLNLSFRFHQ